MAYNLDGGHSTSLVFMGKELSMVSLQNNQYDNIRGLSDVVMFLEIDQSILDAREQAKQGNENEKPPANGGNG